MVYGILASGSCLLSDISDRLSESAKKKNTIDRLSKHLQAGVPEDALNSYLTIVKNSVLSEPIVHIDDSDVVKPSSQHFESLGRVRAGHREKDSIHTRSRLQPWRTPHDVFDKTDRLWAETMRFSELRSHCE